MSEKYHEIFISENEPSLPGLKIYLNSSENKLYYRDFENKEWDNISVSLPDINSLINTHNSDTTNVHGIANTANLATLSDLSNQISGLSSVYLTQANAASTYLSQAGAASNYLSQINAASTYLSQINAASTYLTQLNAVSDYLTKNDASSTYLTQTSASSTYLSQASASSTYLTQTNAASTYLTQSSASTTYDTAEQVMVVALSDEGTSITSGISKLTIRAPFGMTLTKIPRAYLNTASTSGAPTVDINVSGSSILGANKLSIDINEKTSTTATTATTLITTAVADDAEITFDIDAAGNGAKGLKVALYYKKA